MLKAFLLVSMMVFLSGFAPGTGRWYVSINNDCAVFAEDTFQSLRFQGDCVDGAASGIGTVSLYRHNDLRDLYEGYFVKGYYINDTEIEGRIVSIAEQDYFLLTPNSKQLQVLARLDPKIKDSSLCNDDIIIALQLEKHQLNQDTAKFFAEAGLKSFAKVCSRYGQSGDLNQLTVRFVPSDSLLSGIKAKAVASAVWIGDAWQVSSVRLSQSLSDNTTAPSASNDSSNDIAIYIAVTKSMELGYPVCQVAVGVRNNQNVALESFGVEGVAKTNEGVVIGQFQAVRSSSLQPQARATMRRNLPGTACNYIDHIQLTQVACQINGVVNNTCQNQVMLESVPTLEDGVTVIPNVRIYF